MKKKVQITKNQLIDMTLERMMKILKPMDEIGLAFGLSCHLSEIWKRACIAKSPAAEGFDEICCRLMELVGKMVGDITRSRNEKN